MTDDGEIMTDESIGVAIVEDDRLTREGLQALVATAAGFRCTGAFGSVEAALDGLSDQPTELLLLDIHLPGILGSVGVRPLRERYPGLQIVMLTALIEEERIFESLCNGACGYLLKRTSPDRLLDALREAHQGGSPMSPDIARKVVMTFHTPAVRHSPGPSLTPHEQRILQMLAKGDSYQEVGGRLDISVNTVRNYIRSIYDKLQVHSKSEAVSKAMREKLIT